MLPLILCFLYVALVSAKCYEPSQAHPLPELDPNDAVLTDAFAAVSAALTLAVDGPEFAATSFSVEVTSSKESLWSYHHTARERNASRPDIPTVNSDALYRIASISKIFTVLGVLYQHAAGNMSLDDPIDKYIAELKGEQEGSIPWKDITLRSLASQLSGIPRDCVLPKPRIHGCFTFAVAQADIINSDKLSPYAPEQFGFPPVSRDGLIECDEYAPNYKPSCGEADLIKVVTSAAPVFAPNQKSTYSNIAFELLGVAIEKVTNQTYESYINDAIFKPLNMTKSTLSTPPDSAGVIPLEPHYWGIDAGIQNPTGGIYSSAADLSKLLRYILTHYNSITHAANWVHPVSPSNGLHSFYGMPWEIFHTDRILEKSQRTVKFITKSGGLPGYTSIIITVPEYDLGFTILLAGNFDLFEKIREAVTVTVVRAAEQVVIKQLQKRYAGTYASPNPELNSSMTLVADHRGLVVTEFISNATDVMATDLLLAFGRKSEDFYVQLVPTLLYRNETAQSGELWRIVVAAERTEEERDIWDDFCMTEVGAVRYAGLPANEIAFWDGKGKEFKKLEIVGFRATLSRIKNNDARPALKQEIFEL
ncbi:beta-lactamase/transpeptidase-like protein [Melanomma pulvis-pyrius CBS 109.77]|uniref:Beta-lactamase/transpeptidase-like protein n=1 Tax=Melanomma pulvis-pyrius CBS 109.77 TaxID=1314802 RepID=A0A6A6XND7_9PLEO|nr:beta-lactamase/transpeptidase-like protein [Melanomma pulvis-pyrius CBS 109.77]